MEVTGNGFTSGGAVRLSYDILSGSGPTTHKTGQKTLTSNGTGNFLGRNSGRIDLTPLRWKKRPTH